MSARKRIDAPAVLHSGRVYMEDAALFPEQFKPGVVRQHLRDYAKLTAAIDELLAASDEFRRDMCGRTEDRWYKALDAFMPVLR